MMLAGRSIVAVLGVLSLSSSPALVSCFSAGSASVPLSLRGTSHSLFSSKPAPSLAHKSSFTRSGLHNALPSLQNSGRRATSSAIVTKAALEGYSSLLTFDSPAAWAAFLLWATPIPLVISSLCKFAEDKSGPSSIEALPQGAGAPAAGEPGIQRNLMWAFPSFGCFLESIDDQPPSFMPAWQKWALLINGWGGIAWYLYYKYQIEEELKRYSGEGLGGLAVVAPFALGFFGGITGEILFGSLEHEPLYDLCSTAFWGGFAWIYVMQFKLYSKVNELYESRGLTKPLLVWGLLVPGYNFVTGIRQIHFLSQFWAMERGEAPERDAFCELFPFATKETLGVLEFFTSPELLVNWERLGLSAPKFGSQN